MSEVEVHSPPDGVAPTVSASLGSSAGACATSTQVPATKQFPGFPQRAAIDVAVSSATKPLNGCSNLQSELRTSRQRHPSLLRRKNHRISKLSAWDRIRPYE